MHDDEELEEEVEMEERRRRREGEDVRLREETIGTVAGFDKVLVRAVNSC